MTTIAFLGQFLRRYRLILGCAGFLNGVERGYIFDVIIAGTDELGIHDIVAAGPIPVGLDCINQILSILGGEAWRRRVVTNSMSAMATATLRA